MQKRHKYVFKDCLSHYETLTDTFHKKFKKKLLIGGSYGSHGFALSKASNDLFAAFSSEIIEEILTSDSIIDITYMENENIIYYSQIKTLKNFKFLFSRYITDADNSFLFNIFLLNGELPEMKKYWRHF